MEAARKAEGWGFKPGHTRAQILYYIAENLNARADEFARRLVSMTGAKLKDAQAEVEAALERLFTYAAYCDKYGGEIKETTLRGIVMGLHEPVGVIGIACPDDAPLLGFVSLVAPAIARGNTVVVIPSERYPAERDRLLSGAGNVGRSGGGGQHRHGRARHADQDAGGSR